MQLLQVQQQIAIMPFQFLQGFSSCEFNICFSKHSLIDGFYEYFLSGKPKVFLGFDKYGKLNS
jgi:hypothetical protein